MHTTIALQNTADHAVLVYVTLGATPGCLQDVSKIPWVTDVLSPLQGSFMLPKHGGARAWAPEKLGFNGNLSFGTPPLNCPIPPFPNGVNLFEFIVNNAFQGANAQETVDISCVAGVNARIGAVFAQIMDAHASTALPWNAGPQHPRVGRIENGAIGTNTGRVGVFPVRCDNCTASVNPPSCSPGPTHETPQSSAICNVQRNASGSGGLVIVSYHGAL